MKIAKKGVKEVEGARPERGKAPMGAGEGGWSRSFPEGGVRGRNRRDGWEI